MSRFIRILMSVTLALGLTLASARESYFPDRDGLSWTYDNGQMQVLSGLTEIGGQAVMVLVNYLEGQPISEEYLVFHERGVYFMGTSAAGQLLVYDPPLLLYQASPLQVGQSWRSTTRVQGIEITLAAEVVGVRGVQTPAGRFNTLQIRQQTITSTGGQTALDLFFVPTVGIVRFVTQDGTVVDLIDKNF
jgi:hypothetical protein